MQPGKSGSDINILWQRWRIMSLWNNWTELEVCQRQEDQDYFAVVCVRIASLAEMLSESHSPFWWNLL